MTRSLKKEDPVAAAPLSGKVTVGTLSGAATGIVTAILVYAIPAWHDGIPSYLIPVIPVALTAAGNFLGGYQARHRPTVAEVTTAIDDAARLIMKAESAGISVASPVGKTSPTGGAL